MSKSSDNLSQFRKPIVTQNVNTNFSFKPFLAGPFRSLSFSQSTGQSIEKRAKRYSGVGYSFSASINPDLRKGLSNSFSYSKNGNTSKRGNLNTSISGALSYTFFHTIGTRANYSESRSRQDYEYFVRKSSSIQDTVIYERSTIGRNLSAGINITEALSNSFSYSNNRATDDASDDQNSPRRGTNSEDRSFRWSGDGSFKPHDRVVISVGVDYNSKKKATLPNREGFRRDDLDNQTEDVTTNSSITLKVSNDHSFTLSGNIVRNSYDTPSRSEVNDKDNLTQVFLLSYSGTLAEGMKLSSSMRVAQTHLVFLNAVNSANNRWNRDYTLDARTSYRLGGKADVSHSYSIAAYHIADDYDEDYFTNRTIPKSTVRRRWSMQHNIGSGMSGGLQCSASYSFWLEDFGNLFKDGRWIVIEDKAQHAATFSFSYRPVSWLSIGPGTTYTLRKDWKHDYKTGRETRELTDRSVFKTFSLSISYNASPENTLNFSLSRTARESLRRKPSSDDSMTVNYSRRL
jgi:hypothetical protein